MKLNAFGEYVVEMVPLPNIPEVSALGEYSGLHKILTLWIIEIIKRKSCLIGDLNKFQSYPPNMRSAPSLFLSFSLWKTDYINTILFCNIIFTAISFFLVYGSAAGPGIERRLQPSQAYIPRQCCYITMDSKTTGPQNGHLHWSVMLCFVRLALQNSSLKQQQILCKLVKKSSERRVFFQS